MPAALRRHSLLIREKLNKIILLAKISQHENDVRLKSRMLFECKKKIGITDRTILFRK